ncbi:Di-copper centre-containing protein [Choiromyces venosus 120613-1]|uniref:Di-copper centre-containing protein n=1 Tax=Choiromyces venosus 120613-1 TaxID=1336337 RepID=A0A3N4K4F4_9PEZI|nr:Di-copper centre-containing protein [Choiromyces venosus 120613-1]
MSFRIPSVSACSKLLLAFSIGLSLVSAHPMAQAEDDAARGCKHPRIRKEWRQMSQRERADYHAALNCLHSIPGLYQDKVPGLSSYEDYVYLHKSHTPYVHLVGHFLPWHRYFLWTFETQLRDECGYKGAQPYWDYTLDEAVNLHSSPIFSPTAGFGGDGDYVANQTTPPDLPRGTGGGCIHDGPYANWTIHISRNTTLFREDRCLQRSINPDVAAYWTTPQRQADILAQPDYGWMSKVLEGGPSWETLGIHGAGHFIVGGTDGEVFTSNAEPLFYLHHANLDRIWWKWQQDEPSVRYSDISGPIRPWSNVLGPVYEGLPYGNVTLDFEMYLERVAGTIKVRDVMNTMAGMLCYEYTD